jgi:hypothetical protein
MSGFLLSYFFISFKNIIKLDDSASWLIIDGSKSTIFIVFRVKPTIIVALIITITTITVIIS